MSGQTNASGSTLFSERHQLVQQLQMIGGGSAGPQAASAVRHVAAQNGVWSLGNFGNELPPKSAMQFYQPEAQVSASAPDQVVSQAQVPAEPAGPLTVKVEDHDYRYIFNSCSVGMVSPLLSTIRVVALHSALTSCLLQ